MGYNKVNIFDFDGTLINTSTPDTGKGIWKDKTGSDWPHIGWWSKVESLDMGVFDNNVVPGIIDEYVEASGDSDALLVMLTGRRDREGLRNSVKAILDKNGIVFDRYYHNGGGETADNKMYRMGKLLEEFPTIREIEFWDDREPHILRFKQWAIEMVSKDIIDTFIMNHVDNKGVVGGEISINRDIISSDKFRKGIYKYGYNSEFRREYESLCEQLKYDELNDFFKKWEIK